MQLIKAAVKSSDADSQPKKLLKEKLSEIITKIPSTVSGLISIYTNDAF